MASDVTAFAANLLTFRKAVRRKATDTQSRNADLKENVGWPAEERKHQEESDPTTTGHRKLNQRCYRHIAHTRPNT